MWQDIKDAAFPASVDRAELDEGALPGVLKVAAAGFTGLTGLLTFFGIKDGALDRLVRASAAETMAVFVLVGLGVVLALVAPVVKATMKVPLHWILAMALAVVLFTGLVGGRDLMVGPSGQWLTLGGVVAVVAVVLTLIHLAHRRHRVPWGVGLAILSLTLVSCGLYNAAKLTVLDKLDTVGASITANLTQADGQRSLTVNVSGKDVVTPVRVQVEGLGPDTHPVLSGHTLTPDRTDSLAAEITVPVSGSTWTELRVVACQDEPTEGAPACRPTDVYAKFPLHRDPVVVGASLTLDAKASTVTYAVEATSVPRTSYLVVAVGQGKTPVGSGRKVPAADGTVTWTGTTPVRSRQTWTVSVAVCDGSSSPVTCRPADVLATLGVP